MNTDSTASSSLADTTDVAPQGAPPADAPLSSDQNAENQAPANEPSGDTPASPPDAPVDNRTALLAIVKKVVEAGPKNPSQGEGTPAALEVKVDDPNQAPTPEALEVDPTEDEVKALPARTKARIEKLLTQRNSARTETEALKPDAAKWHQMDGFLRKNDLAAEDVNLLLGAGAALRRGDFKAFRDGVMPYVELCNQALGLSLSPELQEKVDNGEIDAEAARELSTTRFANSRLQGQAQANTNAAAAAAQAEATAGIQRSVSDAVTSWEQQVQARDPDYALKASTVLRVSQALMAEHGRPTTAEDAVKMAQRAYDEANVTVAALRPAPVATHQQPSGARNPSGVRPEPKSLMEAALQGLERGRRRG